MDLRLGSCFVVASLSLGFCSVVDAGELFTYRMTSARAGQGSSVDLHVFLDYKFETDRIIAWSLGVCHDNSLLTINTVENGTTTQALNDGAGPDIYFPNVYPEGPTGPGWTVGVVTSSIGFEHLPPGVEYDLHIANYTVIGEVGRQTSVCPCNEQIGEPVTPLYVIDGDFPFPAAAECGGVNILAPQFIRGDCNGEVYHNLADAIYTLSFLFRFGSSGPCLDACDTNDDGQVDLADVVRTLHYLFLDGPPPSGPYPECSDDLTLDGLSCNQPPLQCP